MWAFWERGYEATSMTDLTAAMEINSPSLYAAFGSKEALFRETIGLYSETEGAVTQRALREARTARAAVEAMLRGSADAYTDPGKPAGCMIVLSAVNATAGNDAVRGFLADCRQQDLSDLRGRMDQAVADGDLPSSTDTSVLAAFYNTVLYGMSIQARDGASREELYTIVDAALVAWDALTSPMIAGPHRAQGPDVAGPVGAQP